MAELIIEKEEIALCNSNLETKLIFSTEESAKRWIEIQIQLHGKVPDLRLCRRTTRIVTEIIE